jgi:bifunctional UDP-N-acetylglucosamine pyrophosphorylase/glucosamine-1-phosphate N-acetyltransferase
MNNTVKIVILAAGQGKRMQSEVPKVLAPLAGKHMIQHLLDRVAKASPEKPIVIVGYKADLVKKELGDACTYVLQEEQLGTGHAVTCAEDACGDAEHIVVLSGDQPFISEKTIRDLIYKNLNSDAKITFATTDLPDFEDWRKAFINFGRVIRKDSGVVGVREYKDATEEEKNIREVNAGCYTFEAKWLWINLKKIRNENVQKEYYLTDLFKIASENNEKIETIKINPREALGANSKEELEILEKMV